MPFVDPYVIGHKNVFSCQRTTIGFKSERMEVKVILKLQLWSWGVCKERHSLPLHWEVLLPQVWDGVQFSTSSQVIMIQCGPNHTLRNTRLDKYWGLWNFFRGLWADPFGSWFRLKCCAVSNWRDWIVCLSPTHLHPGRLQFNPKSGEGRCEPVPRKDSFGDYSQGIGRSHWVDALLLEIDQVEQILICLLISLTRILITQKQCFISSGKAQDYSEKKSNILAELFNNTLPIKIDTLLEFVSFKRPSKFLEQGGYSWALGEVLAWNPAGKSARLLCGVCVWH